MGLRDPAKVSSQEIVRLAERALAEVRSLTGESVELSLAEEVEAARSLLAGAGVEVRVDLPDGPLPGAAPLATVLREAVTNVVRHSAASRCEISVVVDEDGVRLRVVNDGAAVAVPSHRDGTGLASLRERIGGRLTTSLADGTFTLTAELSAAR